MAGFRACVSSIVPFPAPVFEPSADISQPPVLRRTTGQCDGFLTLAAIRWSMIVGYVRVSTTQQNLGLRHDDLKPAFDVSVDPTNGTQVFGTCPSL